jgi:hypothetical protein
MSIPFPVPRERWTADGRRLTVNIGPEWADRGNLDVLIRPVVPLAAVSRPRILLPPR